MSGDLDFYKLSGAGNDFIALTAMPEAAPGDLARTLCRRGLSIGADGLFVLERQAPDGDTSRLRMRHWNADGGAAELCLNGTRCAALLAFELGWAEGDQVVLVTGAGPVTAERTQTGVRTHVPTPTEPVLTTFERETNGTGGEPSAVEGYVCSSGVPHVVRLLPGTEWDALDISTEGAWLRSHPRLGGPGANVNFVYRSSDSADAKPIALRTFERGVEGETLACGTGAVATAAVLHRVEGLQQARFKTRGGFVLEVSQQGSAWYLEGDARIVARGSVCPGAFG